MTSIVLAVVWYSLTFSVSDSIVFDVIAKESRYRARANSKEGDYGLMQVRVSKNQLRHLLGREYVLYEPWVNIKYGCYMLAHWKRYHDKNCRHGHDWILHYRHGVKIKWKK